MKLKSGCYERYKEAHDNIWPEVAASMKENGINMAIYHQSDGHLFIHATAPTPSHWERSRLHPAMPKWQAAMTELIETDDQGEVRYEALEPAFVFGEFKERVPQAS
ncbi:hypothetical protein BH09VER1_BH09VER1_36340 [soil metagenome]